MAHDSTTQYCTIGLPDGILFETGPYPDQKTALQTVLDLLRNSSSPAGTMRFYSDPHAAGLDGPDVTSFATVSFSGTDRTPQITEHDPNEPWPTTAVEPPHASITMEAPEVATPETPATPTLTIKVRAADPEDKSAGLDAGT